MAKKWDELTKDELLKRIDQCAQYSALAMGIPSEEGDRMSAVYEVAKNELITLGNKNIY